VSELITFKFRFVDAKGNPQGFLAKRGSFDGTNLVLAKETIPAAAIMGAASRVGRMLVRVDNGSEGVREIVMTVGSNRELSALLAAINRACSKGWAERERERLTAAGRGHEFRSEQCPGCSSTLILSRMAPTGQIYCTYCDTLTTIEPGPLGQAVQTAETAFRCCDRCGYYAKPSDFTTFYFYFLVVVYGFRYKQGRMCNTCMRAEGWKMLAFNAPFILGLFVAIPQLIRAYAGGSAFNPVFAGLDKGNAAAKAGKAEAALRQYAELEQRLGLCAGVRFNKGLALAKAQKIEEAALAFEEALEDCSNYTPAVMPLVRCYAVLKRDADAERLAKQWSDEA
jgi:hypothetical protein